MLLRPSCGRHSAFHKPQRNRPSGRGNGIRRNTTALRELLVGSVAKFTDILMTGGLPTETAIACHWRKKQNNARHG